MSWQEKTRWRQYYAPEVFLWITFQYTKRLINKLAITDQDSVTARDGLPINGFSRV